MKTMLLAACCLSLSLAACTSSRPQPTDERTNASIEAPPVQLTHTIAGQSRPDFLHRLFRRAPRHVDTLRLASGQRMPTLPHKLKNSQLTIVVGDNNRVSQASADKVKAPLVQASDSSTLNAVASGGNLATVKGNGNTLEQTAQPPPKPAGIGTWLQRIGKVLMVGGIGYLLWPLLTLLFAFITRRKSAQPND